MGSLRESQFGFPESVIAWKNVGVVQSLSHVQLFVTPLAAAYQASLSFTIYQSLLILIFIESMMPSNHLILCHPIFQLSIFPSIRLSSNELALRIRWPKYWSFSISPSSEYSGLISFRIDWSHFLAVQGTLKSLLQHHNLKCQAWKNKVAFFLFIHLPAYALLICGLSEQHLCKGPKDFSFQMQISVQKTPINRTNSQHILLVETSPPQHK